MAATTTVKSLSAAQEAALRDSLDDWLAVGRSTAPVDRARAEAAWRSMYAEIGAADAPTLWFTSPFLCILAWGVLSQLYSQLGSQLDSQLGSQLGSQLDSQLGSQLYSQLGSQLDSQLYSQLGSQLRSQLYSQLDSQLDSQLYSQLRSQLYSQLRSQLYSQLRIAWWDQWWSYWIAFYDWPERHLASEGFTYDKQASRRLALWRESSRCGHCWFPYGSVILASERPTVLRLDQEGRFHCEDGAALEYADGYCLYAWHGVRFDWEKAHAITAPDSLTVAEITGEQNAEVRRVMLERFGAGRYVRESGARCRHEGSLPDGTWARLYRVELGDDEPLQMLELENATVEADGSRKPYWLRVPPDVSGVVEAAAWTFDLSAGDYVVAQAS